MDNIKNYRENELKQYVVANALIFLLMHGMLDFTNLLIIASIWGLWKFKFNYKSA